MDFQPSPFRIVIYPEASKAQNSIAAVSALGRTVCVLIRRLNSSCSRSMAFVTGIGFLVPKRSNTALAECVNFARPAPPACGHI